MMCIIILVVGGLAWFEIIPVRYWARKAKISYEGKKTRMIIQIIKWFEWFL